MSVLIYSNWGGPFPITKHQMKERGTFGEMNQGSKEEVRVKNRTKWLAQNKGTKTKNS